MSSECVLFTLLPAEGWVTVTSVDLKSPLPRNSSPAQTLAFHKPGAQTWEFGASGRECSNLWHGLKSFMGKRFWSDGWVRLALVWRSQSETIPANLCLLLWLNSCQMVPGGPDGTERIKIQAKQWVKPQCPFPGILERRTRNHCRGSNWFEPQPHAAPLNHLQAFLCPHNIC